MQQGSRISSRTCRSLVRSLAVALFSLAALLSAWSQVPATTSVTLAWDPSPADSVFAYRVYYGAESLTYTNALSLGNVTVARVDGLIPGTTYYFAATAVGPDGAESEFSNEVPYTVPAIEADPLAVEITSVAVSGLGRTATVKVQWGAAGQEVSGYYLYCGASSTVYTEVRWVDFPPNELEFSELARAHTYYFAVSAVSSDGTEGPLSTEASIVVPPPELPPIVVQLETPGGAEAASPKVLLSWADVGAPGYIAHYQTSDGSLAGSVIADPGSTEVLIESLERGHTYYFIVKPLFPGEVEGTPSDQVVFTIPPLAGPRTTLLLSREGRLVLRAEAAPGSVYEVLTSTDREAWDVSAMVTANGQGEILYLVPGDLSGPQRFYCLRWVALNPL